ncbi:hypothetical protein KCP75_19050 [Salmonella enterica subsp. enterica]|nr:hypothetical protein KCP75_19050 [Salmonella enterica subsp. enterica]
MKGMRVSFTAGTLMMTTYSSFPGTYVNSLSADGGAVASVRRLICAFIRVNGNPADARPADFVTHG